MNNIWAEESYNFFVCGFMGLLVFSLTWTTLSRFFKRHSGHAAKRGGLRLQNSPYSYIPFRWGYLRRWLRICCWIISYAEVISEKTLRKKEGLNLFSPSFFLFLFLFLLWLAVPVKCFQVFLPLHHFPIG